MKVSRVCGGRLNFEHNSSASTSGLLEAVGSSLSKNFVDRGPKIEGNVDDLNKALIPVLQTLFPEDAPPPDVPRQSRGVVASNLWQSNLVEFALNKPTSKHYADEHIVRGAAGAAVFLGFAAAYHLNPTPVAGNIPSTSTQVTTLMEGLRSGALLQWWLNAVDYVAMCQRQNPSSDVPGHSVIFSKYITEQQNGGERVTKIVVIDNIGEQEYAIADAGTDHQAIQAANFTPAVWIAANWTE